eukprot:9085259-Pyramimonas_sp.AAC.2
MAGLVSCNKWLVHERRPLENRNVVAHRNGVRFKAPTVPGTQHTTFGEHLAAQSTRLFKLRTSERINTTKSFSDVTACRYRQREHHMQTERGSVPCRLGQAAQASTTSLGSRATHGGRISHRRQALRIRIRNRVVSSSSFDAEVAAVESGFEALIAMVRRSCGAGHAVSHQFLSRCDTIIKLMQPRECPTVASQEICAVGRFRCLAVCPEGFRWGAYSTYADQRSTVHFSGLGEEAFSPCLNPTHQSCPPS